MIDVVDQLFCAKTKAVPLHVEPVKSGMSNKPLGGLWTSSLTPDSEWCSDWVDWTARNMPSWLTEECYVLIPREDAKLLVIDSMDDLNAALEKYELLQPSV